MNVVVSNSSDVPLYVQIKEQIKDAILKGELEDGELLPSIRSFANDVQVSVLTVRRVYEELEKEGFAVRRAEAPSFLWAIWNCSEIQNAASLNRIYKRLFIMQNCLTLQKMICMQCWIFYTRRIKDG